MVSRIIALIRTLQPEVTDDGRDEGYPIKAPELLLPHTPSGLGPEWLPGVTGAARELSWVLLNVCQQAKRWGTVSAAHIAVHLTADNDRRDEIRVGYFHYVIAHTNLSTFRAASRELALAGYVTRGRGNTTLSPTPELVRAVMS
jgi:hypothetical protein